MADKKNTTAKKETVAKTNTAAAIAATVAKKAEPAAPVAKTADTTAKKTEAPKAAEKKAPAKKAEAPKKTAAKKAEPKKRGRKPAVKKAEPRVQEVYFEFDGKQVEAGQVVSLIEQAYKNEGHQIGRIKDLKVYINSEEGKAYYVINGDDGEGKYIEL
ncbi:DUF6465 family protein [Jutongia sp.]|uniref:DUF6465 family protein n=1 Tax=Jutongia sp. TaxID=2944204 RepID=UPI0003362D12|nr:putative uncharacterized protein [Clostridium sp. CAG:277]